MTGTVCVKVCVVVLCVRFRNPCGRIGCGFDAITFLQLLQRPQHVHSCDGFSVCKDYSEWPGPLKMPYNAETCPVAWLVNEHNATALDQLKSDLNDQMASSIVMAVALLLVSSFLLFWGSRLVRPTLFITSFLAVGVATLAVMPKIVSHTSATENTSCLLVGITPIATGVLAGCVALCCLTLGMALLGAGAGSAAGYALYIGVLYRWPLETIGSTTLMLILSTSLGAFVGACIIVRLQKSVLIFATSAIGACGAVAAMAMLLAHANVRVRPPPPSPLRPPCLQSAPSMDGSFSGATRCRPRSAGSLPRLATP